jgi:signal transduction histidine kinase
VPWPLWGAVVAVCYAVHIGLIARFVLLVLDRNPPWLVRSIYVALGLSVTLACASFALALPKLWTAGLVVLQAISIVCLPYVVHGALVARRRIAGVLMAAGTLAILAGAHDLLLVRMGLFGGAYYTLTPHAMFFFVMILAGLVVERYSRTVADYSALNANLAARVAEREEQLRGAFETVRQQREQQAVLLERQRIMREIHDGVGSQLVGLLNVVTQATPDRSVVEEHVKLALDEMRMAVDSLQPTQDDLSTVLATLRYRLQPRLDAARIELVWDVDVIPPVAPFAAQAALQLQRILLEAFTNVLKHAAATRIVMQVSWHGEQTPPLVRIVLTDNGRGLPAAPVADRPAGHGIANMRSRALAIGARLHIETADAPAGGTRVLLDWPCALP